MTTNPLLRWNDDPDDPAPLVELKTRIVLYAADPPGPDTARSIYDIYSARFGASVTGYRSTALGSELEEWTPLARHRFETAELPALRQRENWGYMFGADQPADARLFLFHGSRPVSEAGRASLFRFDFEWDFDPESLRQFALDVLRSVECMCGTIGYVLVPDEGDYAAPAYSLMFAWARRYWGAEAQDLDAIVEFALSGFPCVSWLTIIGPELRQKDTDALDRARAAATATYDVHDHVVFQAENRPRLIDRNRRESLGNYPAVAEALAPFQAPTPMPFGGELWDEDNTRRYLQRFTSPANV